MRFAYADDSGYAALGLSGNPFVAESESGVAADLWIARDGVPPPPQPHQRRLIQLIGPKGAGKTSHLLHWRALAAGPYHYVPPGPGRWRPPPVAPLVYWDEVDRLARPVRAGSLAYAAARGATVVAGTHEDLGGVARRCGLAVTTYEFPALTPAVLLEWAGLRIAETALPGRTPDLVPDDATAQVICERVGASLRDAALELHVWTAERARAAVVEVLVDLVVDDGGGFGDRGDRPRAPAGGFPGAKETGTRRWSGRRIGCEVVDRSVTAPET